MGCCVSAEESEFRQQRKRRQSEEREMRYACSMGVGMGVAMMMQQAGAMVGAAPSTNMDPSAIQGQIRKAKAEGRTVTLVNGSLYFDYQLVARIPPGYDVRV